MDEKPHILTAIKALEAQRKELGDEAVDVAVGALRSALMRIEEPRREQRKLVTVLFGDVSGFTSLAERTDPERVTAAVNKLWRSIDSTIMEYGGTVDKHIGDAVMALFGAPVAREDDAIQAVRAALAIQSKMKDISSDIGWGEEEIRMRIGLHTGTVHLATVGTTGEYTAMGDTVNLSSRLQNVASEGGVLVSYDTWLHIRDVFEADPRPPLSIKGKSRPVKTFEIRSERPVGWDRNAYEIMGFKVPLVGREKILKALGDGLNDLVESNNGQSILIIGDRGMGKSRICDHFSRKLMRLDSPVLSMRCRAGRGSDKTPFALLRSLVFQRFRILDSDSDIVAVGKLEQGIGETIDDGAEETAHLIGHLAGMDLGKSRHIAPFLSDPRNLRIRAIACLIRYFGKLAKNGPVAFFLENIHLADEGSRFLAQKLCRAAEDYPFFILMSSDPSITEKDTTFIEAAAVKTLNIEPLTEKSASKLVGDVLKKAGRFNADIVEKVVETAAGHPYYLEELIRMVLEDQSIDDSSRGGESYLAVPPALTALLQARLDALPDNSRNLLKKASVVGREFWDSVLLFMDKQNNPSDEKMNRLIIEDLIKREMIVENAQSLFGGLRQFSFRSSMLQEVAYETVLLRNRKKYHEDAARWIADQAGDSAMVWAARIAEHWHKTDNEMAAGSWFLKAGEYARKISAFSDALRSYEQSLFYLLKDPHAGPFRLMAYDGLHEVQIRQGMYTEAEKTGHDMLEEALRLKDEAGQSRAWWTISRTMQITSRFEEALEAAQRSVQLAEVSGNYANLVPAMTDMGLCLYRLGRLDEASDALEKSLEHAKRGKFLEDQSMCLRLMGAVQSRKGMFKKAEIYAEQALELLRDMGDIIRGSASLLTLGELARMRGDLKKAEERYRESLEMARNMGVTGHEFVGMNNLGGVLVAQGNYPAGEKMLSELLGRVPDDWYGLPETWRFFAEAKLATGKISEAVEAGKKSLSLCLQNSNAELLGPAWRLLGEVASHAGIPISLEDGEYGAGACFKESRRILSEAGLQPEEARTLRSWARHEIRFGDPGEGRKKWQAAHELFKKLGMDYELEQTPLDPPF